MDLQPITNNNPPPAQSVLQYSVNPDTVFVSTNTQPMYANLTITVFNPSQTDTVTCQMFQFGFYVGAAYGDLTAEMTGIETSSAQSRARHQQDGHGKLGQPVALPVQRACDGDG